MHHACVRVSVRSLTLCFVVCAVVLCCAVCAQNHLEEMYVNMHRNTFKNMRRFLPVNKVKFQWNSAAHSLASEVNNK